MKNAPLPQISIIAAMSTPTRAIGYQRALPWKKGIPADWENLFNVTAGCKMIMGRKSYDDESRVASAAGNFVVTRQPDYKVEAGFEVVGSLPEALERCRGEQEVYVIGGQSLFEEALPMAQKLVLTYVDAYFEGDVFFPEFDENLFLITDKKVFEPGNGTPFPIRIVTYERKA